MARFALSLSIASLEVATTRPVHCNGDTGYRSKGLQRLRRYINLAILAIKRGLCRKPNCDKMLYDVATRKARKVKSCCDFTYVGFLYKATLFVAL